jgi:hypothetical protein
MKNYAVDANQSEIVAYARALGFSVAVTAKLGQGFPDIVMGKNGINYMVEIKDGKKPPSQRKLSEPEQKFHNAWRGQICIVESCADIDKLYAESLSIK